MPDENLDFANFSTQISDPDECCTCPEQCDEEQDDCVILYDDFYRPYFPESWIAKGKTSEHLGRFCRNKPEPYLSNNWLGSARIDPKNMRLILEPGDDVRSFVGLGTGTFGWTDGYSHMFLVEITEGDTVTVSMQGDIKMKIVTGSHIEMIGANSTYTVDTVISGGELLCELCFFEDKYNVGSDANYDPPSNNFAFLIDGEIIFSYNDWTDAVGGTEQSIEADSGNAENVYVTALILEDVIQDDYSYGYGYYSYGDCASCNRLCWPFDPPASLTVELAGYPDTGTPINTTSNWNGTCEVFPTEDPYKFFGTFSERVAVQVASEPQQGNGGNSNECSPGDTFYSIVNFCQVQLKKNVHNGYVGGTGAGDAPGVCAIHVNFGYTGDDPSLRDYVSGDNTFPTCTAVRHTYGGVGYLGGNFGGFFYRGRSNGTNETSVVIDGSTGYQQNSPPPGTVTISQ